jgi:hypothetical protein
VKADRIGAGLCYSAGRIVDEPARDGVISEVTDGKSPKIQHMRAFAAPTARPEVASEMPGFIASAKAKRTCARDLRL